MLYQNEEPLVQRTCIKTANLQSKVPVSKAVLPEKVESDIPVSGESIREKSDYKVPEELTLQTLICGHQVLTSLSDKSLVSICQNPNMRIQTVEDTSRGLLMNYAMMRLKSNFVVGIGHSYCIIRIAQAIASFVKI